MQAPAGLSSTIYAVATGAGKSAVAVVRVSGPDAISIAERMSSKPLLPRHMSRVKLRRGTGEFLDDALVVVFPGGNSFTGEDACEFHIHGGTAVISSVLSELALLGTRAAEPGEFSRRAFRNGKLDLVEAEGLADLISAVTDGQRRQALAQMLGASSDVFRQWRDRLMGALAYAEAAIDFSEETEILVGALIEELCGLRDEIVFCLASARSGELLRDGVKVVIAGPPNVGKSSIFNALVARDAAMVSAIPGTTRDVLEAWLDIGGVAVLLADTAGLREATGDELEKQGMLRGLERARNADFVLWVQSEDVSGITPPFDSDTIRIWNKADLSPPPSDDWMPVSALRGQGLQEVLDVLGRRISRQLVGAEGAVVTRERHRQALQSCVDHIERCFSGGVVSRSEIFAEELRHAIEALGRLTGQVDVEDLLDIIFRDFCIGK